MVSFAISSASNTGALGAFICLSLVVVDTAGEEAIFVVAGAEPPLVFGKAARDSRMVEATGMPVGIDPKEEYAARRLRLGPEDIILLLTDGATEARRGKDFFGWRGSDATGAAAPRGSLRQIGQAVLGGARLAGGKLQDDACLLLVRRQGSE